MDRPDPLFATVHPPIDADGELSTSQHIPFDLHDNPRAHVYYLVAHHIEFVKIVQDNNMYLAMVRVDRTGICGYERKITLIGY